MTMKLSVQFIYQDKAKDCPLTKPFAEDKQKEKALLPIVTDVIVGIVGKATESVIDSIIAMTRPKTRTLETTIPLEGFYKKDGESINGGFLVFHNGSDNKGTKASLKAVLKAVVSKDGSAFRFEVMEWEYERFQDEGFFSHDNAHDIALKIEFLTPGTQGLGTRVAYSEHIFHNASKDSLKSLFLKGQALPWMPAPSRGNILNSTVEFMSPLNIQITLLETANPGDLAEWFRETFEKNKTGISKFAQDSTQKVIDPVFAANENMKLFDAGKTAYDDYHKAWEELKTHYDKKPEDQTTNSFTTWQADFNIKSQILSAKKILAIGAFNRAGLPWPGDLARLTPPSII